MIAATFVALPSHAPAARSTPKPMHTPKAKPTHTPIPLPVIYHAEVSPLCAALAHHIKPVIGMMLQNDRTIAQSPPLLHRYNAALDNETRSGESQNTGERDLTLYHLEQLVGPLARNVLAMQKELQDPAAFPPNPTTDETRQLDRMRSDLLKALATQAVALDIVNGYVQTQQLAQMQNEGLHGANLNAITQHETTYSPPATTPNPMLVDPNQAGLAPNPYTMDPLAVPGIAGSVGNTPLSRLIDALQWVRAETQRRENIAAQSILHANGACASRPAASPSPHP
ncbi:MAG TPA: hypothetical protein VIN40_07640 [Candidatus Tyrphobacter sp.]